MLLLNIGTSWLAGKIVDDRIEEGIKWGVEGIANGSVATTARYFGLGTGLALFALHKGRDVLLPQFAEIEVTFNRPLFLELGAERKTLGLPERDDDRKNIKPCDGK